MPYPTFHFPDFGIRRVPSSHSLEDQTVLIASLQDPAYYPHPAPAVEHLQTHISHILLTGEFAYKIKKALNLGFLDFTSLEQRRYDCVEEPRLNRWLAPDLHLDCVSIIANQAGRSRPAWLAIPSNAPRGCAVFSKARCSTGLGGRPIATPASRSVGAPIGHFPSYRLHRRSRYALRAAHTGPPTHGGDFIQTRLLLTDPADREVLTAVKQWTLAAFKHPCY